MNMKTLFVALLLSLAVVAGGCAATGSSQEPMPAAANTEAAPQAEAAASEEAKPMSEDERVAKAVEAHNETADDDDRIVCRRYKKTGSHFSRTRCVTAAQAKREREEAQDALQRASRGSITPPTN